MTLRVRALGLHTGRHGGAGQPYPSPDRPDYGFGFCATVPEGVAIPPELREWRLPGGLYAAMESSEDVGRPCLEEHFRNANPEGSGHDYSVTLLAAAKKR